MDSHHHDRHGLTGCRQRRGGALSPAAIRGRTRDSGRADADASSEPGARRPPCAGPAARLNHAGTGEGRKTTDPPPSVPPRQSLHASGRQPLFKHGGTRSKHVRLQAPDYARSPGTTCILGAPRIMARPLPHHQPHDKVAQKLGQPTTATVFKVMLRRAGECRRAGWGRS